jgi:hypothetical protein
MRLTQLSTALALLAHFFAESAIADEPFFNVSGPAYVLKKTYEKENDSIYWMGSSGIVQGAVFNPSDLRWHPLCRRVGAAYDIKIKLNKKTGELQIHDPQFDVLFEGDLAKDPNPDDGLRDYQGTMITAGRGDAARVMVMNASSYFSVFTRLMAGPEGFSTKDAEGKVLINPGFKCSSP